MTREESVVSEKMVQKKSPEQSNSYRWSLAVAIFLFPGAPNVMVFLKSLLCHYISFMRRYYKEDVLPSVGPMTDEQRHLCKVTVVHIRAFSRKRWLALLLI